MFSLFVYPSFCPFHSFLLYLTLLSCPISISIFLFAPGHSLLSISDSFTLIISPTTLHSTNTLSTIFFFSVLHREQLSPVIFIFLSSSLSLTFPNALFFLFVYSLQCSFHSGCSSFMIQEMHFCAVYNLHVNNDASALKFKLAALCPDPFAVEIKPNCVN